MLKNIVFLFFCNFILSQNITITSNPQNSKVYFKDKLIGNTPLEVNLTQIGSYKLKHEGYKSIDFEIVPVKKNELSKALLLKELFFVKFEKNTFDFQLSAKFNDINNDKILIGFQNPIFDFTNEKVIGKINGKEKKLSSKDIHRIIGFTENLEERLFNSFDESYIIPFYFEKTKYFQDNSFLHSPKIIFVPKIKEMNFDLKGDLLRDYSGKVKSKINWELYNVDNLNSKLKEIETIIEFDRLENNYNLILHEIMFKSQLKLSENLDLLIELKKIEQDYLLNNIGDKIQLPLIQNNSNNGVLKIDNLSQNVVTIENEKGFGSGFFITKDGCILTNAHVVDSEDDNYVLYKNKKIAAKVLKINKSVDLALLKIEEVTDAFELCKEQFNISEEVFAIGTPIDKSLNKTITKGIISAKRKINVVDFIQTDVSINSGNSGGPLLNNKGQVIGINTMKISKENVSGLGFAIDINFALKMLNIN